MKWIKKIRKAVKLYKLVAQYANDVEVFYYTRLLPEYRADQPTTLTRDEQRVLVVILEPIAKLGARIPD